MRLPGLMLILIVLLAVVPDEANAKSVKAYYDGREATVTGVVLRPGEPFTVDLYITPDADAYAYAEITEPGVTRAYDRVDGDPIRPTVTRYCNASYPAHYRWVMAANGNWIDGTAPLNIYYQWSPAGETTLAGTGLFTVVEAYIAPGENANASDAPQAKTPASGLPGSIFSILAVAAANAVRGRTVARAGARARDAGPVTTSVPFVPSVPFVSNAHKVFNFIMAQFYEINDCVSPPPRQRCTRTGVGRTIA